MTSVMEQRALRLASARATTADVLVVGGGINGVGVALDAAARGLRTVLVERDDLAAGTSSRSSKLIHGGLRYLERLRFGLVREALAERHLLTTRLAPHLVRMERFLVPVRGGRWQVPYIGAGLTLYDLLGGSRSGRFRHLAKDEARDRAPALRSDGLVSAFEYGDAVVDDARFVVAVARTAIRHGATVLTRCEMVGEDGGGVTVRDLVSGEVTELPAQVVVDATGAYEAESPGYTGRLHPSRGSHLVVPRSAIPSAAGLTLRVPGRVVFCVPWGAHWLIGTTDVPHREPMSRPHATAEEVAYLVGAVEEAVEVRLGRDDIVATFAGIRPLVGEGDDTVAMSREESIEERKPGLVVVRGGKYTTYRPVAGRVVDVAARTLGRLPASPTAGIPLAGAAAPSTLSRLVDQVVTTTGMQREAAAHLVSRHGTEAAALAELGREEGLLDPLVGGLAYLEAEVVWAVREEQALSLDDVLARRTRLAIESADHGASVAGRVAELMGAELGWDGRQREEAVRGYLASSTAEYGVPDRGADG